MTAPERHLVDVECPAWCADPAAHVDSEHPDFGHCRTDGKRILHRLERPIDMDDWSAGHDFTELGAGVERATRVPYVWDRHSDGREVLMTPGEARAKASALVAMAELAESRR